LIDRVVVDTDVVSFLFRGDSRADLYAADLAGRRLYISFMTLAELRRWGILHAWGQRRRAALEAHLQRFVVDWPDDALCTKWAEVMVETQRGGRRMGIADAWQAATALVNAMPLVTHNRADFLAVPDLEVISHAPV
jgi:tRNA(fMet)-specific endonuclease VapC